MIIFLKYFVLKVITYTMSLKLTICKADSSKIKVNIKSSCKQI